METSNIAYDPGSNILREGETPSPEYLCPYPLLRYAVELNLKIPAIAFNLYYFYKYL
jgi:hypothetical protein